MRTEMDEEPIAVIDIGSNSIRLVAYNSLSRVPIPIFNEKHLAGLGRHVALDGRLGDDAIEDSLRALTRFKAMCEQIRVDTIHIIATAAVRDAANGPEFVASVEALFGRPIAVLSGREEAHYAAMGIMSGIWQPDGIIGDLGGGSLELVELSGAKLGDGTTLSAGSLWLEGRSDGDLDVARSMVVCELGKVDFLHRMKGRTFYAIGGTWRALARLHMVRNKYPLHVMQNYELTADELQSFCRKIVDEEIEDIAGVKAISGQRRPLLHYGALAMDELLQIGQPESVVVSALGVREGLLFSLLGEEQKREDPLISSSRYYSETRSRSTAQATELISWVDRLFERVHIEESEAEKRLRHAACLLSDIGWQAHPDYRGELSLSVIAHSPFTGIDHAGRAFLALTTFYRYNGPGSSSPQPWLEEMAGERLGLRARITGAVARLAYVLNGSMPGVLPAIDFQFDGETLTLFIAKDHEDLNGERVARRVHQLAKHIGCRGTIALMH